MTSLFDDIVSRQVGIERMKSGEANELLKLIEKLDIDIINTLNNLSENYTRKQLNKTLDEIQKNTIDFYNAKVIDELNKTSRKVIASEVNFSVKIIKTYLTDDKVEEPKNRNIFDKVMKTPFQKKLLSNWASDLATDKYKRIKINVNMAANENAAPMQLATVAKQQIKISNNNAKKVSNAYVSQSSNISRDETYAQNPKTVEELVWSSILDSGTTITCGVRSQKKYDAITKKPIGHKNEWNGGPGVIHWNCRSTAIPINENGIIVSGSGKGQKYNTGTRAAIGAEKGYEKGGDLNQDGTRSKIPSKNNQLEKQLIPANQDYSTWLKKQPRAFVEDALGKGKAELFLNNKISLQSFAVENGRELTLDELNKKVK